VSEDEVLHVRFDRALTLEQRVANRRQQDRVQDWNRRALIQQALVARQPALWASSLAVNFEPSAILGQYPKRFTAWAARVLNVQPDQVLHVCSGALPKGHGLRVDIRQSAAPDVRADGRRLPFRDSSFRAVAIDPPYSAEYAAELYGVDYPRPSALLREAARVLVPGGMVGILHFLVPSPEPGLRFIRAHGITTGAGYRIRAFTVYQRAQSSFIPDLAERASDRGAEMRRRVRKG
jgi:hypothetical protein